MKLKVEPTRVAKGAPGLVSTPERGGAGVAVGAMGLLDLTTLAVACVFAYDVRLEGLWPWRVVELEIETAGIAQELVRRRAAPQRGLRCVAVGAH